MARATERHHQVFAAGVAITVLGAMLWPLSTGRDGFPLSNFPMFSHNKDQVAVIHHVVGISAEGNHRPLHPEHLGTDEIMQASQTAKLAVHGGTADSLCRRAAKNVARDAAMADITDLQVRIDWFDAIAYWTGDRKPRRTVLAARCSVGAQ